MTNAHDPRTLEERLQWIADWSEPDIDLADAGTAREALDRIKADEATIARLREQVADLAYTLGCIANEDWANMTADDARREARAALNGEAGNA